MQKNRNQVLKEADEIRLKEYCQDELNDMVDYRTGDILTTREYASHPMLREDRDRMLDPFGAIVSHTQMRRFMASKDRRRLNLFNGCRGIYDMDKGKACLEQGGIVFPTNLMLKLSSLVERIDYKNVIVTTPQDLSAWLEIKHTNLHRHLYSLKGLINVSGPREGVAKGSIKVKVSPVYGFRYEASDMDYVRGSEIEAWYLLALAKQSGGNVSGEESVIDAA